MKIPQMIAAEFRRLTSTKMSVLALLALVAVPVLYGGLYLWANQDPYAKFAEVPVALVVEDEGTPATADAAARNVGDEIAAEVVADGAFDWHSHPETDELFLVHRGQLIIHYRDHSVHLGAGDIHVVPKGAEHKPEAKSPCEVVLFEPKRHAQHR